MLFEVARVSLFLLCIRYWYRLHETRFYAYEFYRHFSVYILCLFFFNYVYLWCFMPRYSSEMTKIKIINQICISTGCWHSHQPIRGHVWYSILTNMDFNPFFYSNSSLRCSHGEALYVRPFPATHVHSIHFQMRRCCIRKNRTLPILLFNIFTMLQEN